MAPHTYRVTHLSPTGVVKGVYTPSQARMPAFSLRVTGEGDCVNGVARLLARAHDVRAGDWLQVELDDGQSAGLVARYAGEIRVAAGATMPTSSDLNLAGGMARLATVEVREPRVPLVGDADTGAIARDVLSNADQTGTAISTSGALVADSGLATNLTPYFAPLGDVLRGLAGAAGQVVGVNAGRQVFMRAPGTGVLALNENDAHVRVEARQVSAESICTAVRWVLGAADDGVLITYLSVSPQAAVWGTHVNVVQLSDGLSYLKKVVDFYVYDASPGVYMTKLSASGYDPNTGQQKVTVTYEMYRPPGHPGMMYGTIKSEPNGTPIDLAETRTYTPDLDQITEINAINQGAPDWQPGPAVNHQRRKVSTLNGGYTVKAASATDDGSAASIMLLDPVFYTIDRAALDARAQGLYRTPVSDPVSVHVHGRWLAPQPYVQLTRAGGAVQTERVAEIEYVAQAGWWGTVVHIGQRDDGVAEAAAQAIVNRDRDAQNAAQRALGTPLNI